MKTRINEHIMTIGNKDLKFLFIFLLTFILVFSKAPAAWAQKPIKFEPYKIKIKVPHKNLWVRMNSKT